MLALDGRNGALDGDDMLPIVAEIVGVFETLDAGLADAGEGQARLAGHVVGGARIAVALAGDVEVVQVRVVPAHDCLDDLVQVAQGHVGGDEQTTPDRRTDTLQGYLQFDDVSG